MHFFGDVNLSVIKNRFLNAFNLIIFYLTTKGVIILIFHCILLFQFDFDPFKLCELATMNLVIVVFLQTIWKCTVLNGDVTRWRPIISRDCSLQREK